MKKVLGLLVFLAVSGCTKDTELNEYVTDNSFKFMTISETHIYDITNDGVFNPTEADPFPEDYDEKYQTAYYAIAGYSFFDKEKMILDDLNHGEWDGGDNYDAYTKIISSNNGILKSESGDEADFTVKGQISVKYVMIGSINDTPTYGALVIIKYKLIP